MMTQVDMSAIVASAVAKVDIRICSSSRPDRAPKNDRRAGGKAPFSNSNAATQLPGLEREIGL